MNSSWVPGGDGNEGGSNRIAKRPKIFLLAMLGGLISLAALFISLREGTGRGNSHQPLSAEIGDLLANIGAALVVLETAPSWQTAVLRFVNAADTSVHLLAEPGAGPHRSLRNDEVTATETLLTRLGTALDSVRYLTEVTDGGPETAALARSVLDAAVSDAAAVNNEITELRRQDLEAFESTERRLMIAASLVTLLLVIVVWRIERSWIVTIAEQAASQRRMAGTLEAIPDMITRNSRDGTYATDAQTRLRPHSCLYLRSIA